MRVLVAPDTFKGTLTAEAAATAMAAGWRDAWPGSEIICRPVADGGEGTAEAVCRALGGSWREHKVCDPLGRPVVARYTVVGPTEARTALVDCSGASGYLRVAPEERDLARSSTFGTGELLRDAFAEPGVREVIVGLGGSATNDGGFGMAAALGYVFLDAAGKTLSVPAELGRLATIIPPIKRPWLECPVTAACDVQNPLLGPRGATRVYGPQKGLRPPQQEDLERGLRRLADVAKTSLGTDFREAAGAGAAGGLGFGLLTFCGATLEPGFRLVARLLDLESAVAAADLVLTGEGAADAQSLEGKAPHGVAALARRFGKPTILIAGHIPPADRHALQTHFDALYALTETDHPLETCLQDAANVLRHVTATAAADWRVRRAAST